MIDIFLNLPDCRIALKRLLVQLMVCIQNVLLQGGNDPLLLQNFKNQAYRIHRDLPSHNDTIFAYYSIGKGDCPTKFQKRIYKQKEPTYSNATLKYVGALPVMSAATQSSVFQLYDWQVFCQPCFWRPSTNPLKQAF